MITPLVSVVMAVYNAKPFLSQALDSILGQTFPDFELILIDDGSTDGSGDILSSYADPRLIILKNEQNLGLTRSLNKGLSIARGCFIARHDADDISDPDRFRQQVNMLERAPNLGLIGTNHYVIDQNNQILDTVQYPSSNEELQSLLMEHNCFCHGSVMFRNSCFKTVGGYREQFRVTQDYDLWLRIAEQYDLASLPEFLYKFRFHANTISQNKIDLQLSYEHLAHDLAEQRRTDGQEGLIPENVLDFYPPHPQRIFDDALTSAYYLFASGDYPGAEVALKRAKAVLAKYTIRFLTWEEWIFGEARHLSVLRDQLEEGTGFINWAYQVLSLPNGGKLRRLTLGNFYADQAFLAHQNSKDREVIRNAYLVVICDFRWLNNRGLLKIILKSIMTLVLLVSGEIIREKLESITESDHNNDIA